MTIAPFTDAELLAYVDELLPLQQTAAIEKALRQSAELRQRAAHLARRRDQGGHTVGEIWRRRRLSCPGRNVLGSYLLGVLARDAEDYVRFHVEAIGCRYCAANLRDLQQSLETQPDAGRRRERIFESSAGYLRSTES